MSSYGQRYSKIRRVPAKLLLLFALLLLIGLVEFAAILWKLDSDELATNTPSYSSGSSQPAAESFDKALYSVNKASSIWVVVNKGRILPADYVPGLTVPNAALRYSAANTEMRLRTDAAKALEQLFTRAANDKIYLRLASGYRSYYTQASIYAREIRTYGQKQADRQSARPGHSEHQTGLAADLAPKDGRCEIADCFADTAEGKWLAKNAYRDGFILRYPDGKEDETGYRYEPWHFRYVGKALAAEKNKTAQTLERFFGLPIYTSYLAQNYKLL
ncbi:MAG TPA: M15 family metallopeptidase [Candidatus Saccharimonadales bacterium]|nr:M15 family metallopeptidase [Candidatus Saccharimonadales bacterium]